MPPEIPGELDPFDFGVPTASSGDFFGDSFSKSSAAFANSTFGKPLAPSRTPARSGCTWGNTRPPWRAAAWPHPPRRARAAARNVHGAGSGAQTAAKPQLACVSSVGGLFGQGDPSAADARSAMCHLDFDDPSRPQTSTLDRGSRQKGSVRCQGRAPSGHHRRCQAALLVVPPVRKTPAAASARAPPPCAPTGPKRSVDAVGWVYGVPKALEHRAALPRAHVPARHPSRA